MQNTTRSGVYTMDVLIREIENHDIISFDIFDTLVMRTVYYNKDVFRQMAQQHFAMEIGVTRPAVAFPVAGETLIPIRF